MAVSMRLGRTVAARASVARRARAVAGTFRGGVKKGWGNWARLALTEQRTPGRGAPSDGDS